MGQVGGVRAGAGRSAAAGSVAVFVLVSLATHVHLTGDGPYYAASVAERLRTGASASFWDAGHLLWRPLAFALLSITRLPAGAAGATFTMMSWSSAAACAVLMPLWLRSLCFRAASVVWASAAMVCANAFLSYYQGGSSYFAALACLLMGLHLLSKGPGSGSAIAAGLALAASVFFWLPFVLVLPAALGAPVLLRGWTRANLRSAAISSTVTAIVGVTVYGAVALYLNITSPAGFIAWVGEASHGITGVSGAPRAAFGFARSFLNMGLDGAVLKRFMLHDPFNPVSIAELVRLTLAKLAFFYVVVAALVYAVWRYRREHLGFLVASALPVLAFAVAWQGGDPERYVPLYPAFAIALACSLEAPVRWTRTISQAFVLFAAVTNIAASSKSAFRESEQRIRSRMSGFREEHLPFGSIVVTPVAGDGLAEYFTSGAAGNAGAPGMVSVLGLITPGFESAPHWRAALARHADTAWSRGGRVWIAQRMLASKPGAGWGWIEGEDPRLRWNDFPRFFSEYELGQALGGSDGFVEVLPTSRNRLLLGRARQQHP